MIVTRVVAETDPTEFMVAFLAGHVRTASILLDDDPAHRAWLSSHDLSEVGEIIDFHFIEVGQVSDEFVFQRDLSFLGPLIF